MQGLEVLETSNDAREAQLLAVTKGLLRVGYAPENVVMRVIKEDGYRERTMYWIGHTPSGNVPICCVGPLTHTIGCAGIKSYTPEYFVEVYYGSPGESFFEDYFRKDDKYRKPDIYDRI